MNIIIGKGSNAVIYDNAELSYIHDKSKYYENNPIRPVFEKYVLKFGQITKSEILFNMEIENVSLFVPCFGID